MISEPNNINARKLLDDFINQGLENYSRSRNFDHGLTVEPMYRTYPLSLGKE